MTLGWLRQRLGIALLTLGSLSLWSCSESIDTELERRSLNEQAFLNYSTNSDGFARVTSPGFFEDAYIYMKTTTSGSGTVHPKYTDYVKFYYTLYSLEEYRAGGRIKIESNHGSGSQAAVQAARVSAHIPGVTIALQHMVVGEKATAIIPWYLAYGSMGSGGGRIPSYTALVFELELIDILGEESE